jgi:hypothetical protein
MIKPMHENQAVELGCMAGMQPHTTMIGNSAASALCHIKGMWNAYLTLMFHPIVGNHITETW